MEQAPSSGTFPVSVPAFKSEILQTLASGYRTNDSGGLNNVGSNGSYWAAVPNSAANGRNLNFNASNVNPLNTNNRANGFSVRAVRAFDNLCRFYFYEILTRQNPRTSYIRLSFRAKEYQESFPPS